MFFYNRPSKFSKRFIRVVADICIWRERENFAGIITFYFSPSNDNFRSLKQNISLPALDWFAYLAPIRQVVICVEGIEVSIVAVTAPRVLWNRKELA